MKTSIFLSIIFLTTVKAFSQPIVLTPLKKADNLYEKFSYAEAVLFYKTALEKGENQRYISTQIAFSYRNLNLSDSAEVWFRKVSDLSEDTSLVHYYLGEALMSNGKYQEAKYWFEKYLESNPGDSRTKRKMESINNLDQFSNEPEFILTKLPINSTALDFSPAYSANGIVFVSSRKRSKWINREFNWDQSEFLDLYEFNDSTESVTFITSGLNTKYHEGPLCFFDDYKKVVYTRNNHDGRKLVKDQKGITHLKISLQNGMTARKNG